MNSRPPFQILQSPNFEILLTTLKKMRPPSSSSAADRFPQTELWPQLFVVFALQFCFLVIFWFHFLECFYPRKSGQRYSSATDRVGRTELRPQLSLHCPLLILDVKQRPTVGDTPPDPPPPPSWHPPSHPPMGVGWAVTDGEVGSKYQVPWRSHFRTI